MSVARHLAWLLGLTACGGSTESAAPKVVGFAQIGAEGDWRAAQTRSIQAAADARGIQLRLTDAQARPENQIRALQSFLAQGVDAVLLAPVHASGFGPVLEELASAGIPVVLIERGVDSDAYETLIASDLVEQGRQAARWLARRTNGDCAVVELQGTPGSAPAIERRRGFAEELALHPQLSLLASRAGDFSRAQGKQAMEDLLQVHGRAIGAVYAHNDDLALGAIEALEEAGIGPGSEVLVISIDGLRSAFDAILAGKLNATVECNPLVGPLVFDALESIWRGESVEPRIVVPDRLFDASNAAQELPHRRY